MLCYTHYITGVTGFDLGTEVVTAIQDPGLVKQGTKINDDTNTVIDAESAAMWADFEAATSVVAEERVLVAA